MQLTVMKRNIQIFDFKQTEYDLFIGDISNMWQYGVDISQLAANKIQSYYDRTSNTNIPMGESRHMV